MSQILNQYGNPVRSERNFNRASSGNTPDRPWRPIDLKDIGQLIRPQQRRVMVAVSRDLGENWGPVKSIFRQIPMHSIGKAWKPSLESGSETKRKKAETVIREQFYPMAGLDGKDFIQKLYEMALLLLRDGECFYMLTEWKTGFPAIQIIPSHQIGNRNRMFTNKPETIKEGPYKGLRIDDGVVINRYGTPVAYRLLGDKLDGSEDEDISARSIGHIFDSDYPEARRGYPVIAHSLNDGRDALQSHEWEMLNMLARSAHTFIEHSESGIPDDDSDAHLSGDGSQHAGSDKMHTGTLFGGTVKTVRAGTGYKLEAIQHDTPGEIWESFQDRAIRKVCVGVPWPMSLVWEGGKRGSGTGERRDIMQARCTIEDIQCTIEPHAKRILGYAFKKLVKTGSVDDVSDWWRWSFKKPAKITIDDGRVSKATLEMWRAGLVSDDDILDEMGKESSDYWSMKFEKAADKEIAFEKIQETKGVELDPRYKGMFTPNDMGEAEKEQPETNQKPTEDNEDD